MIRGLLDSTDHFWAWTAPSIWFHLGKAGLFPARTPESSVYLDGRLRLPIITLESGERADLIDPLAAPWKPPELISAAIIFIASLVH